VLLADEENVYKIKTKQPFLNTHTNFE